MESLLPDAIQMIQTTRLLFFSSLFSAEDGDCQRRDHQARHRPEIHTPRGPRGTLIAFLISLADTRILSQAFGEVCRGKALEDTDLIRLMSVQDPSPWRERLAAAFRGERVLFIEAGRYGLEGAFRISVPCSKARTGGGTSASGSLRPLLKKGYAQALQSFELLEVQAKIPYYQSRDVLRARDRQIKERPWYAFLSKMMIGDSEAAFMKEAMVEAIMLTSRAGLACRLYKSRNGQLPGDA